MIHDSVASTVALARTVLGGLDVRKENTEVRTATLKHLLEQLIDLGAPPQNDRFNEAAAKTVVGSLAALTGVFDGRS